MGDYLDSLQKFMGQGANFLFGKEGTAAIPGTEAIPGFVNNNMDWVPTVAGTEGSAATAGSTGAIGGIGSLVKGVGSVMGGIGALKNAKIAADTLNFQKNAEYLDTTNQVKMTNSQLADMQNARLNSTGNPGSQESIDNSIANYMAQWGVQDYSGNSYYKDNVANQNTKQG